ncbi:hypothetical protein M0R45_008617 [Rubus argutus]|uniref:TIR domain-containing protein n=1 Tax=Rubus argutus TaxID=59490 RepID=A0AAW1Y252_RUBAR
MSIQRTTTSSPPQWKKYDVFLSFRGDDTRKAFTDYLYASLVHQGIITFRDEPELQKGKAISSELFSAIKESRFALIVLSPNYASSTWCLDELVTILDCMKATEMTVLPIFYNVDPSDVRKQAGSFGEAFTKHEERFRDDKEKLQRWRSALTQVASFSGWNSKEWYESKLIEDIVDVIWKKLQPILFSSVENLVGIDSRLQPINLLLGAGVDDVRFIGIWGMGGVGKRSRLWLPKDINYVLSKNTGTEAIEGIFVDSTNESGVEVDVNAKSFSVMSKLRYLKINCSNLPDGLDCLPNSLRILKWTGYPSKSLPQHFNPEKLLDLSLCHSVNILSTPDFRVMPYLELLTLEGCRRLYKVHPSIEELSSLIVLNLKDCKNLVHFASSLHGLKSLKVLNLSGCSRVNKLPNDMGHLENCLEKLDVSGTGIRELPSSIGLLKNLQDLSLRGSAASFRHYRSFHLMYG